MRSGLGWHPRHRQPSPQREEVFVIEYIDPASTTHYTDEAAITREEAERQFAAAAVRAADAEVDLDEAVDDTFGIPRAARLPLPARSGPRLDPEATARVGRRLQAEREELLALERAGLIDRRETR